MTGSLFVLFFFCFLTHRSESFEKDLPSGLIVDIILYYRVWRFVDRCLACLLAMKKGDGVNLVLTKICMFSFFF